jgi:tetratricopeptide (TPR) repeat protein
MTDAEGLVDELDEYQWVRMRAMGASEEEISRAKVHKQRKEDVSLYMLIIKQRAWDFDMSCTFTDAYLRLCSALEGLVRRPEAIAKLYEALNKQPTNPQIMLALAKLLFKNDQKDASLALCNEIFAMYASRDTQASDTEESESTTISAEDAADAYYLGGWVKIHDDDHTNAYRIWQEGHLAVPTSELLATQYRKRACWDESFTATDARVSNHNAHLPHAPAAYTLLYLAVALSHISTPFSV